MTDQLAEHARGIIDTNSYLTVATVDEEGRPWVTPVYFATADYVNFFWASTLDALHSRNVAVRPAVSAVIFDSTVLPYTGRAVYLNAVATELAGEDLEQGLTVYPGRPALGASPVTVEDVTAPAPYRLYRATATEHFVLCPRPPGQPCPLHGMAVDHRARVTGLGPRPSGSTRPPGA